MGIKTVREWECDRCGAVQKETKIQRLKWKVIIQGPAVTVGTLAGPKPNSLLCPACVTKFRTWLTLGVKNG